MISKFQKTISLMIIANFVIPAHLLHAKETGRQISISVVPVSDGNSDEKAVEAAQTIASSLKFATPYHVVDTKLTAQVLEYYDRSDDGDVADPAVREAEETISKAKEYYFQFSYKNAREELDRAISILESKKDNLALVGSKLVDAYISRALAAKSSGDQPTAKNDLAKALTINPNLDLAAQQYPPSIISTYNEEKAKLAGGPAGSISVKTNPSVADVYLNGILQGSSPLTISRLPTGSYTISVRANRYKTIDKQVTIAGGEEKKIDEKLKWSSNRPSKASVAEVAESAEVGEGLKIADIMKTDKTILIDVDTSDGKETTTSRMVDRQFGVGQPPISIETKEGKPDTGKMAAMVSGLNSLAMKNIPSNPEKNINPKGIGKTTLMGKQKKKFFGTPLFWGIVGGLAAGALGGGLVLAFTGGGGGSSNGPGSVLVQFGAASR